MPQINNQEVSCIFLANQILYYLIISLNFGAFVKNNLIVMKDEDGIEYVICKVSDLKILGDHNVENALAAAAIVVPWWQRGDLAADSSLGNKAAEDG